jgi:hypothetical protein
MNQKSSKSWLMAVALVICGGSMLSTFAQDRTVWRTASDIRNNIRGSIVGTVADIDPSRNRVLLLADSDRTTRINIMADSISTQYSGYAGVVDGQPEILSGSSGFERVRAGDRLEVRGVGFADGSVSAEQILLLGRSSNAVSAPVGQSSGQSGGQGSNNTDVQGRLEGVVRQVNLAESRLVIESDRRQMFTITGSATTPVNFRGQVYAIGNIEVGDRVRVDPYAASTSGGEIQARSIDVLSSVSDGTPAGSMDRTVASITGRVTRIEQRGETIWVDTGRPTEIRVDTRNVSDDSGRKIHAADFQVGDRVTISGTYDRNDNFRASSIRFGGDSAGGGRSSNPGYDPDAPSGTLSGAASSPRSGGLVTTADYVSTVIYARVQETLGSAPTLLLKDTAAGVNRTLRVLVSDDFAVRTKTGTYVMADSLKVGDQVVVKAYRDPSGNYIAQTIRMR